MGLKRIFVFILIFCSLDLIAATIESSGGGSLLPYPRFVYQLIAGTGDASYASGGITAPTSGGSPVGYIGIVNKILGNSNLNSKLAGCGYKTCGSVPISGTCSSGTYEISFHTPLKIIPAGMTGANGTAKYEKRVEATVGGVEFLNMEFSCNASVGWVRITDNVTEPSTPRNIEMYYDTENADSTIIEFAMYYEKAINNKEYLQAKFITAASNKYDLFVTSASDKGSEVGDRVGIRGDSSTQKATVYLLHQQGGYDNATTNYTDGNEILNEPIGPTNGTGDIMCLDFSDKFNITAVDGNCAGLSIGAQGVLLINNTGDISIGSTSGDLKNNMTSF